MVQSAGWRGVAALLFLALGFAPGTAPAGETRVAVAANFTEAANEIAGAFLEETGHQVALSFGATGQLYTQIGQGAPFDVFLAADQARPAKALSEGLAVEGSGFTYAIGRIVLWSADPALVKGAETLALGAFRKIAVADPATAPYGAAAMETMAALGVADALAPRIVTGKNIGQTFQFVQTGNAELGFVALSQVAASENGSRWVVPAELYTPIRQDAVLLKTGAANEAAIAFVAFLKGEKARAIIEKYGYGTESAK